MKLKQRKFDNQVERQLLTALIVSRSFLAQAAPVLERELDAMSGIPLFKLVADWCLGFYHEYEDAPGKHVETIFQSWSDEGTAEDDLVDSAHDLLEDLSGEYEKRAGGLNVPFLRDQLSKFLVKRKLNALHEEVDAALSRGDAAGAQDAITSYKTPEIGESQGVDFLNDRSAWARAFSETLEPIVTFPGAAGQFLDHALTRDAFVVVQAPEKRGKTWWLTEFAWRALRSRRRVAFFEVGDLSEGQLLARFGSRLCGLPLRARDLGKIKYPKTIVPDHEDPSGTRVRYHYEKIRHVANEGRAWRAAKRFRRATGIDLGPDNPFVQVSTHPNDSISVSGIEGVLDRWVVEKGFVPDVIVIDYADILAPEEASEDEQREINTTWKRLRAMSQKRHALVITATQANAGSYDARTMSMKHFSRDKRKYAHPTGVLGLNQTPEEKEQGIVRLNWIVGREFDYSTARCLWAGTCYKRGRALTTSAL